MSYRKSQDRKKKLKRLMRIFVWVQFEPQKVEHNGRWSAKPQ